MHDKDPGYSGRGYGSVTVIVKNNAHFSLKEINIASDRIVAVGIHDKLDSQGDSSLNRTWNHNRSFSIQMYTLLCIFRYSAVWRSQKVGHFFLFGLPDH